MVFEPVLSTPSEIDTLLDPDSPEFGFAIDHWAESPPYVATDGEEKEIFYRRMANANTYKQNGSFVAWHRYITLGYYIYDDCNNFEAYWRQFVCKQTLCMKIVWFNFMYHVDRHLDIPLKLQTWATEVARPHLSQLDPVFLRIDTQTTTWQTLLANALRMDAEDHDDCPWTLVDTPKSAGSKAKRFPPHLNLFDSARIRPPASSPSPVAGQSSLKLSSLRSTTTKVATSPSAPSLFKPSVHKPRRADAPVPKSSLGPPLLGSLPAASTSPTRPSMAWNVPQASQTVNVDPVADSNMADSKMPAFLTIKNAPTNDGTHRLTFRWKPVDNYQKLADNPVEWLSTFLEILKLLFADRDGTFYRWESEDLTASCSISTLTSEALRDYISPKIASLATISTFVFGLRFRFADRSPIPWRNHKHTKAVLHDQGLGLTLSNSTCSSGRLGIAGYLLLRH
jgi:hypothetical protein